MVVLVEWVPERLEEVVDIAERPEELVHHQRIVVAVGMDMPLAEVEEQVVQQEVEMHLAGRWCSKRSYPRA